MEQEEAGRCYVRMEEEEEGGTPIHRQPIGFASPHTEPDDPGPKPSTTIPPEILRSLTEERGKIIDNDKLSSREKLKLLDNNRRTMVIATGGRINRTENVVYSILVFGGSVLVILSLLTVFADLPAEVTLSFVGTVLGGTIATIAQKLGKL